MDTECRIMWLEDGREEDVLIRTTEYNNDSDDDQVFYYGMSKAECIRACETKIACDSEWRIVEVYD